MVILFTDFVEHMHEAEHLPDKGRGGDLHGSTV